MNEHIAIMDITDIEFNPYGKLLTGYNLTQIIKYAKNHIQIPAEGNRYIPSVEELEAFPVAQVIRNEVYGELPIEVGYCAGQNTKLTGLEYHQGSEVVIAATDCIHIVGKLQDIKNDTYDSSNVKAFFQPKGTAVELYSTTLHYAPCRVSDEGYLTIVILPEGTNLPLENAGSSSGKNVLLTKKNKFLMVHSSQKAKIDSGVHPGLIGELIEIKTK